MASAQPEFPEPTAPRADRAAVLLGYLDYFRETVIAAVDGMPGDVALGSVLPSGWSPAELLHHLRHVERRWLEWGFLGLDVGDPWADRAGTDRWLLPAGATPATVLAALREQGERTREIVLAHPLDAVGAPGPRWEGAPAATLERVLLHLVQEYARHTGQLDVVDELTTGRTGE
ncbi:mycothiol transferase [Pseudonocardia phyllosphaerae]|uniref:mycothiol transferase n=1 Tax=Pseudonocardia phyllosphaerae TaxID=3390502 RepID=UPI00397CBE41